MNATLEEIESVYRRRYAELLRVATAISGSEQAGGDAVHDGFVRAVRHGKGFRGDGPLEAWLWRIVVNEARKQRSSALQPLVDELHASAAQNGYSSDAAAVRAGVASLPERQRHALFLRYYADLDYQAIAYALGVKPGTVAATLHAAHATLRTSLKEMEPWKT